MQTGRTNHCWEPNNQVQLVCQYMHWGISFVAVDCETVFLYRFAKHSSGIVVNLNLHRFFFRRSLLSQTNLEHKNVFFKILQEDFSPFIGHTIFMASFNLCSRAICTSSIVSMSNSMNSSSFVSSPASSSWDWQWKRSLTDVGSSFWHSLKPIASISLSSLSVALPG